MKKVTIQFASDLHLEFYKNGNFPRLKQSAPYLVLAGDIGYPFHRSYGEYLESLSPLYKKIFIISGNHEYYQNTEDKKTMMEVDQKIDEIVNSLDNVEYLNNKSSIIEDNVKIIGTTLWSNIPKQKSYMFNYGMSDYHSIYTGDPSINITTETTTDIHRQNVDWLETELKNSLDDKVVVVTHHLPSLEFISEQYKTHPLNNAFYTKLDRLITKPVVAWIAGHTHQCKTFLYNDVQCGVNSRGYPHEVYSGFRDDAVMYI